MATPERKDENLGQVIADKYKLIRLIGQGGMGKVYEAEHLGLGVKRAVKLLHAAPTENTETVQRFRREAQLPGPLHACPYICHVYDLEVAEDGSLCIVMEMLNGEDLAKRIERQGPLSPTEWAQVLNQLAEVLDLVHENGIVHRDLKPQNLFLHKTRSEGEILKVLDFGIAKIRGEVMTLTADGAMMGTPLFMSPEQARGEVKETDHLSDIFSVGSITYYALSGKYPFHASTPFAILYQIWTKRPEPLHDLVQGLPATVDAVVQKSVAKKRTDRYHTVGAMAADLSAAISGETVSLRPGMHIVDQPVDSEPGMSSLDAGDTVVDERTTKGRAPGPAPAQAIAVPQNIESTPAAAVKVGRFPARTVRSRLTAAAALLLAAVAGGIAVWAYLVAAGWRPFKQRKHKDEDKRSRTSITAKIGGLDLESGKKTPGNHPPLTFGIGYFLPPKQIRDEMRALAGYLSTQLGRNVHLVKVPNQEVANRLEAGTLDLAVLSPYYYVLARMKHKKFLLLATQLSDGAMTYEGYIVAKAYSRVKNLSDLRGKRVCYSNPTSTSGYLYPKGLMINSGLIPERDLKSFRFSGTHEATIQDLVDGKCDVATVYSSAYLDTVTRKGADLRIVATTGPIPNDAYCASHHLSADTIGKVRQALAVFEPRRGVGKRFLGRIHRITGFVLVDDRHYDPIRRMHQLVQQADAKTQAPLRPRQTRGTPTKARH